MGYKVLKKVREDYKGLQRVTRGDRGLQRIIENLFYLERLEILFLGLFWIKIKVEEISNF